MGGLFRIALGEVLAHLQQGEGARVLGHQQIAQVPRQSGHEQVTIEALLQDGVELHQGRCYITIGDAVRDAEVVVVVQHIEVLHHLLVGEACAAEAHQLIEDAERITQAAIGLLGDEVQGLRFGFDAFALGDAGQVARDVTDPDPAEIEHLATAQDGRQDLVLLGGGQDEDGIGGRLLQGLQEGVEGVLTQHVHLIDDVHLPGAHLRCDMHLLDKRPNMFNAIIAGGVQLEDAQTVAFSEGATGGAGAAGAEVRVEVLAVDGAGQDAGAGGLAHPPWTREQEGLGEMVAADGVLQRFRHGLLAHHRVEGGGTVLARADDELFHGLRCEDRRPPLLGRACVENFAPPGSVVVGRKRLSINRQGCPLVDGWLDPINRYGRSDGISYLCRPFSTEQSHDQPVRDRLHPYSRFV